MNNEFQIATPASALEARLAEIEQRLNGTLEILREVNRDQIAFAQFAADMRSLVNDSLIANAAKQANALVMLTEFAERTQKTLEAHRVQLERLSVASGLQTLLQ